MKRRTMVEYADASDAVRAVYDEGMATMGLSGVPNWMKAMGNNETVLKANWEKFRHVVLQGNVPPLLKQLILFVISVREDNRYCTAAHGYAALDLDKTLSCEDLYSLASGAALQRLPKAFQVAIDVVSRAALKPAEVAGADFDLERRLRDAGFSEHEIDELLAQADFGVMMNAITSIWDIPPDREFPPPEARRSTAPAPLN